MRAQFLLSSKFVLPELIKSKRREGRRRASFFIAALLLSGQTLLATVTPLYTLRAQAQDKNVPSLSTPDQTETKLESGASGKPLKTQRNAMNDPLTFKPSEYEEKELVNERGQFKEVRQNKDGSKTEKTYFSPKYFQKNGSWQNIDTTLVEDTNAAGGNIASGLLGKVKSVFKGESTFKIKENDWQAKFATSTDKVGMLRIEMNNQKVAIKPINAKKVAPVIRWVDGKQYINYYDIWPGVNLEYTVHSAQVKLNVILKDKNATNNVGFSIDGASLIEHPTEKGAYKLEGALGNDFTVTPVNLILNNYGFETKDVYKQEYKNGQLRMWVNKDYLQSLPQDAFPAVIDPNFTRSMFGSRAGGNYISFKSDGYICGSTVCNPYSGSLRDSNGAWRSWRGAIHSPYSFLAGKDLISANLHLTQRTGASFWTGNYAAHSYAAYYAPCLNSFHCAAGPTSPGYFYFATVGDIDVTEIYRQKVAAGDFGAWLMIIGEECACDTFKNFDPDNSFVDFTYTTSAPMTNPILPVDKQTIITDQPTLSVSNVGNSPSGDMYRYYFRIATNPDGETGSVINSGDQDSTAWTVPEGMLKDGQTYYWKTYTSNWVGGQLRSYTTPNWVRSFKYDARTGNDSTQTFDAAGPISVGLSTGNATTSATSHSINALGGSIGVGFEYNSPKKSKPGLLGEYFNNASFAGPPSLSRVDQKIDFNWANGSPSYGLLNVDSFTTRWSGFFIAPSAGTYYFGGSNDDGMAIKLTLNGVEQQVYYTGCYSGNCFGQAVTLTEGQIVPIKIEYAEATGAAYAKLLIKGAVPEQVIPSEWLRTPLRNADPTTGLKANYYYDSNNHTVPTEISTAFVSRVESKPSFNYGLGSAVPTGPGDNFMATYDGYITVPSSGTYEFGTVADDAARVYVNNQLVVNDWAHDGAVSNAWGGGITLAGGTSVPIRIEYYEIGGGAAFNFFVRGAVVQQEVPAAWLSSKAQVLPAGWQLSLDADGDLSYDYANITSKSVILMDASGSTHEYTWNGTTYTPPVNEYGILVRNTDGSITLQDIDGKTYIFSSDGRLREATLPVDDKKPSALRFEYAGLPARLSKISDGVDPARNGTLHYKGDPACPSSPAGFDSSVPDNMLCAFKTTDGDMTKLFYKQSQLARIELPGGDITDVGYDTHGRITQHRGALANDAIATNTRANDATVTSEIAYDELGRVSKVTEPAAKPGDARREHSYSYSLSKKTYWSDPEQIEGEFPASGLTATNWGTDKIALSYRTPTNTTGYKFYQNGVWTDQANQTSCIRDYPGITSQRDGNIESFVRGCDDRVYRQSFNNGLWSAFTLNPGGALTNAAPSATSWVDGRIDVEIRGVDNALWHGTWVGATWHGPSSLGGVISTGPSVSTWGDNRLNLFVTDMGSPSKVVTRHWAAGWENFTQLTNEPVASSVASVSTPTKDIHVAVRNTSNQLRYMSYSGASNTWSAWTTVAACITDNPTIANQGNGDAVIIYKGCDGKLYQTKQTTVSGNTTMRSSNSSEPTGYSEKIEYDMTLRTVRDYDKAGNSNWVEYHSIKDIILSSTTPTGLKSTTIYDQNDLAIETYGSAPKSWFGASRRPLAVYSTQVPRSDTRYDENIFGLNVSWYDAKGEILFGSPKLHSTGYTQNSNRVAYDGTKPITPTAGMTGIGSRATGKITFPSSGTYTFYGNVDGLDDGYKLFVNNIQLMTKATNNGGANRNQTATFIAVAGRAYDFRIEHIDTGNNGFMSTFLQGPGLPVQASYVTFTNLIKPDYNLQTSTKVYNAQLGDSTTSINYGNNPELGLARSTVEDVGGLNLTTTMGYEVQGAAGSYLRQTSKTLPGGNTYFYQHYGATESIDNPCTVEVDAVSQAGLPKGKTEPDPDLAGPLTGRMTTTIYNKSGDVVATRYNNDPWTCTFYDARGRVVRTEVPSIEGRPSRTITNEYTYWGNPLVSRSADNKGGIIVETDLLGRVIKYYDAYWNETLSNYDANGRLISRTSPLGLEEFTYDVLDRVVLTKLDGVVYAKNSYDNFSSLTQVEYPAAGQQKVEYVRDLYERLSQIKYTLSDGTQNISDSVVRSVGGDIMNGVELGQTKSYTYDGGNRLTSASIAGKTFSYSYDTSNAAICNQPGANLNANKNGNRTSMTTNANGQSVTTQYCYNNADQLVWASDPAFTSPVYDSHGNTTQLGINQFKTTFEYDSSDRNVGILQLDATNSGKATYYDRDVQNRLKGRFTGTFNNWQWTGDNDAYYGYTGSSDTPDFIRDNAWNVVEKYLALPGSIVLTIRPNEPEPTIKNTYSLPNIHGDVFARTNSAGNILATYQTGPFGEVIVGQTMPSNTVKGASYNYVGQHQKLTESDFTTPGGIVQMGARMYVPGLGRFLSVDPIEGGTSNAYVYVLNPVNDFDLEGTISWRSIAKVAVGVAAVAGALACGATVVCGIAVGAAAGAATYAANKAGTKDFKWSGMAKAAVIDGALGAVGGGAGKALGHVAKKTGGVYIARSGSRLYAGQSGNITRRMTQHVASGKLTASAAKNSWKIPVIGSKAVRETYESMIYKSLGTKKAPWLANKVNPRTIKKWRFR